MRIPLPGDVLSLTGAPGAPLLAAAIKGGDHLRILRVAITDDLCVAVGFDPATGAERWAGGFALSDLMAGGWTVVTPSDRFRVVK